MKVTKRRYLQGFVVVVVVLALVRCVFPSIATPRSALATSPKDSLRQKDSMMAVAVEREAHEMVAGEIPVPAGKVAGSRFFNADGTLKKTRIMSVPHFGNAFPDQNDVQLAAANRYGVSPVTNRSDAERRKVELVYVGSNPYFYVDKLNNSIPYLVPRAVVLLQDIGRSFFDSLQVKGVPLHKVIVTSVLRTKEDVQKLRGHNGNATENSCHLYGTTFDICYNRYKTVSDPEGPERRSVRNDTLKWVLSEVLDDMRKSDRCLIKYEVKQGCFHITVK